MALVSGYDSDSDEEAPQPIKLASKAPSSSSPSILSGMNLPPPSNTTLLSSTKSNQKRKPERRQIRIDALDTSQGDEEEEIVFSKRPKVDGSARISGLQGLMGMLPAPKQNGLPPPIEKKRTESSLVTNMGVSGNSEGRLNMDVSASNVKKVKGNNDFRAMLGLKPSSLPKKANSAPKPIPITTTSSLQEIATLKSSVIDAVLKKDEHTYDEEASTPDFFTFQAPSSSSSSDKIKSAFSISTAPMVEEETEDEEAKAKAAIALEEQQYRGWQQGPDGNWFPVTPEAHAIYNDYVKTQAIQDKFADKPADMQYGDIDTIQSVDANTSRQAWQTRPSTEVDSSSTSLDRKYAMAAASIAMPDQGIPLVDQEEEVKKMDKKTNMRARRKGQLSALIAQAEENREKLEERWNRGKEGRNAAKEKYGF